MVKTKKPIWLKILLVCLLSLLTLLLSGCSTIDPWDAKKESDGFIYYLALNNGDVAKLLPANHATIIGLTDEKAQVEELVIPKKLGGKPVTCIGKSFCGWVGAKTKNYGISAQKIKKIVINHDVFIDQDSFGGFSGVLILNARAQIYRSALKTSIRYLQINVDAELLNIIHYYEDMDKETLYNWLQEYKMIEIRFNATGGQQSTYTVLLQQNMLLCNPEQPTKEGYKFAGWYTENTYETQWNFEEDIATENMTLYAKWEESAV